MAKPKSKSKSNPTKKASSGKTASAKTKARAETGNSKAAKDDLHVGSVVLSLLADTSWQDLSLEDVKAESGMAPGRFDEFYSRKDDLLASVVKYIDDESLLHLDVADLDAAPGDRIFEALMARLDILQSNRDGVLAVMDAVRRDPRLIPKLAPLHVNAMKGVLEHASLQQEKIREPFVIAGLLGIYSFALCVWRKDTSRDMAKTMAALDKALRRASMLAELLLRLPKQG